MQYIIRPIFMGRFKNFEKSTFTYRVGVGEKISPPLFCYLVEGNGKHVLVDTGPVSPELAPQKTHLQVHDPVTLTDGLACLGLAPADIDCVILSHLHWDHSYNLELFPDQPIYVQKTELEYMMNPLPCDSACSMEPANGRIIQWFPAFKQMKVVDGDATIMPGIRVLHLPGHTPGMQGIAVDTEEGVCVITSDNCPLYENFERMIPSGIHVDLREWYRSHARMREIADFILPGHDEKVLQRTLYGNLHSENQ